MNIRPRRNRKNAAIRDMVQETRLGAEHLVYPVFLKDGTNIKEEIRSLPNVYRWSIDLFLREIEKCRELDIPAYRVFNNKVLNSLLKQKPETTKELLNIHGVGKKFIENYSTDVLEILH